MEKTTNVHRQLGLYVQEALDKKIFPGCVIGCASKDVKFAVSFGKKDEEQKMNLHDLFDVASLTKAFVNVVSLKTLDPEYLVNGKVIDHVEMKGKYRDMITPEHLLTFGVEYGDHVRLSKALNKDSILDQVLNGDLPRPPGLTYRYTNVSTMILGFLLEKISEQSLDVFLQKNLFAILGMNQTQFGPIEKDLDMVVPVEILPSGEKLIGVVQDEGSRIYGEPSGASGVFTSIDDVLKFGQSFLGKDTYLSPELIKKMGVSHFGQDSALNFGYGLGLRHQNECDLISKNGKPINLLKKNGFSGVHFCVFPNEDFVFAVLANICYPIRPSQEIRDEFTKFHKKVLHLMYQNRDFFL